MEAAPQMLCAEQTGLDMLVAARVARAWERGPLLRAGSTCRGVELMALIGWCRSLCPIDRASPPRQLLAPLAWTVFSGFAITPAMFATLASWGHSDTRAASGHKSGDDDDNNDEVRSGEYASSCETSSDNDGDAEAFLVRGRCGKQRGRSACLSSIMDELRLEPVCRGWISAQPLCTCVLATSLGHMGLRARARCMYSCLFVNM